MRLLLLLAGLLVSALDAAVVVRSIDAVPVAETTDVSVDSATSIQQGCKESRKTCDASVMYFRDTKYRGEWYFLDEQVLNRHSEERTAICNLVPANFMSSIQLRPRKDGRKWGCMLYADSSCKGNNYKGEAIWITESRDRFIDWNDMTKSIKCWIA